ncbi:MAG: CDP-alcohol phosphatidyltransferase family protein [bacterium]
MIETESKKGISKLSWSDKLLAKYFLPLLPGSLTPNQVTVFRFFTIPFVIFLLVHQYYISSFWLFAASAFSDAVDGASARTTHRVTSWGKIADPLADKLLVGSTAVIIISKFISPWFAALIVIMELLIIGRYWLEYKHKKVVGAKVPGKIKMILQCLGVLFLFLFIIFHNPIFVTISVIVLIGALFFAFLSLFIFHSI